MFYYKRYWKFNLFKVYKCHKNKNIKNENIKAEEHSTSFESSFIRSFAFTKMRKGQYTVLHTAVEEKKGMHEQTVVYPAVLHHNTYLIKCQ